jgi:hypothetical protein
MRGTKRVIEMMNGCTGIGKALNREHGRLINKNVTQRGVTLFLLYLKGSLRILKLPKKQAKLISKHVDFVDSTKFSHWKAFFPATIWVSFLVSSNALSIGELFIPRQLDLLLREWCYSLRLQLMFVL